MFFQLLIDFSANSFVLFGEHTHGQVVDSSISVGPPDWRSLDAVMFSIVRVMDILRHDAKNSTQEQIPTSITLLLKILQYILSPLTDNGSHLDLYSNLPAPFFSSCCNVLSVSSFLLTPPVLSQQPSLSSPAQVPPFILNPFQSLFPAAIEFFFHCFSLQSCRRKSVSLSAAEGLLRLCTHGIHHILDQNDPNMPITDILHGIVNATSALLNPSRSNSPGRSVPLKSMQLLLQTVTVVISSCPSPLHRSTLLSMVTHPLIQQLSLNLKSPAWSAAEFTRSLQMVCQIVRYISPLSLNEATSSGQEGVAYIVDFLGAMWPLLDQIATLMSTSEATIVDPVLDCIFSIYKNAVTNMPTLLASQQGVVQEMAERCVSTFFSRQNLEAIDCVAGIVEAFPTSSSSNAGEESFVLLEQILQHSVQSISGNGFIESALHELVRASTDENPGTLVLTKDRLRSEWTFGEEPEAMERFFNFVYQYFLCAPQIILHLSSQSRNEGNEYSIVDGLMQVSLVSLHMFNERDTVRKILAILQSVLIPAVGGDALDTQQHNDLIMVPSLRYSEILLHLIFHLLDPSSVPNHGNGDESSGTRSEGSQILQTGILPSLSETFYSLLVVCDENSIPGIAEWLTHKLISSTSGDNIGNLLLPSIASTSPERSIICGAFFRFAHDRNGRKFKTLMTDIHKVCNGEMDVSGLQDYYV